MVARKSACRSPHVIIARLIIVTDPFGKSVPPRSLMDSFQEPHVSEGQLETKVANLRWYTLITLYRGSPASSPRETTKCSFIGSSGPYATQDFILCEQGPRVNSGGNSLEDYEAELQLHSRFTNCA